MVTFLLTVASGAIMLIAIWCGAIHDAGASDAATVAIGALILLCVTASLGALFNDLGFASAIMIWSVPIAATAFAVGHPTATDMMWYAVSVVFAAILWASGDAPSKAVATALAISGLINL